MKTYTFVILTLATGLLLRTPAHAQEPRTYDPILEKRADLRLKFWHNQNAAQNTASNSAQAQQTASPRAYSGMVDFVTLAAKHSDMRRRAAQIGYAAACEEWMGRCQTKDANRGAVNASHSAAVPVAKRKGKHSATVASADVTALPTPRPIPETAPGANPQK